MIKYNVPFPIYHVEYKVDLLIPMNILLIVNILYSANKCSYVIAA